jgi:hypothetical protein
MHKHETTTTSREIQRNAWEAGEGGGEGGRLTDTR